MTLIKRILSSPYTYIFLLGYFGVWLLWDSIKIPANAPQGITSFLAQNHYNPSTNLLRFMMAVLVPPLVCLLYWALDNKYVRITKKMLLLCRAALISSALLLVVAMGIFQNSTNPANNQPSEYGGPYAHALLDTFHEGETLGPAISYQDPSLKPYRDFVIVHGVFQDPLRSVVAFKLFGQHIGSVRAFTTLLVIFTLLLYYGLLLLLFRGNLIKASLGLTLLAILMLPSGVIPHMSSLLIGVQVPFRDFATIIFLAIAIWSIRKFQLVQQYNGRLAAALLGFVVFASYANSIDRALYISAMAFIWWILVMAIKGAKKALAGLAPYFVAGSFAGILLLGLALKWDYVDFLKYLATMSKYKEYLDGIVFTQPDVARSSLLLILSLSVLLGGVVFLRLLTKQTAKGLSNTAYIKEVARVFNKYLLLYPIEILLFMTGIFFLRSAIGRADFAHFAYSVQWLYLFVIYMVFEHGSLWHKRNALTSNYIAVVLFIITLGHYAITVKHIDIHNDTFPIHVKDESLVRPDYFETAAYIKQHTSKTETFMTLTSEGAWYYLIGKPSPTRYYVVWYAFTTPQRKEIANTIASGEKIKYIITNNNWTSNFDYIPNVQRFPEAYTELYTHYVPSVGIGQQTIWERKPS